LTLSTYEIDAGHPVIIGVGRQCAIRRLAHFVLVVGYRDGRQRWLLADPDRGWQTVEAERLDREWAVAGRAMVVAHPQALRNAGLREQ